MSIKSISSRQNPKLKIWLSLLENRGIKKHGLCLAMGKKIVPEILSEQPNLVEDILVSEGTTPEGFPEDFSLFELPKYIFDELDIFGTKYPILVCKTPTVKTFSHTPALGLEVVTPMGDPANLGGLIRSCEAFGVQKVILLKEAANAFHPKVTKASSGSNLRVPLELGPSLNNFPIDDSVFALDMEGQDLSQMLWPRNLRLLIGEEGPGIPCSIAKTQKIKIPMAPGLESLNALVAASIALYCISQPKAHFSK